MPHVPQCMLHSPPNHRSGDLTPGELARCPRAQDLRCRGGKRRRAPCSQRVRGGTMARVRFRRRPGRGLLDRLWLSRPGGKRIPGRLGYKEKTGAFAEGSHDFGPLAVHRLPTWSCRVGSQRNWVGRSWEQPRGWRRKSSGSAKRNFKLSLRLGMKIIVFTFFCCVKIWNKYFSQVFEHYITAAKQEKSASVIVNLKKYTVEMFCSSQDLACDNLFNIFYQSFNKFMVTFISLRFWVASKPRFTQHEIRKFEEKVEKKNNEKMYYEVKEN